MISNLIIYSTQSRAQVEISEAISAMEVSLTTEMASEISFTVYDPDFRMLKGNYFQIRRPVTYMGLQLEMSAVNAGPGDAPEMVTVQARSSAIQRMKRQKGQKSWGSISPTSFAQMVASEFGLAFLGEPSPGKDEIVRTRNETTDESTWQVLESEAGKLNYLCFESEGRLFFCSEKFLLGKYGNATIPWPADEKSATFQILDTPEIRASDDNPHGAECELQIHWRDGVRLRPGMTFTLTGSKMGPFNLSYLIMSVEWEPETFQPVRVVARTPLDPKLLRKEEVV